VQSEAEGQDTPLRALLIARDGFGAGWTCQAFPFHRSPSGTNVPELSKDRPAAVQEDAAQEMLFN
jgi:hypothetical protein